MNGSGFLLAILMPQGSSRNIWNSAWKELETNSVFLVLTISLFLVQISSRIYNIFSTVLQRLRSKEPTKCDLFKHQIKYLGQSKATVWTHLISGLFISYVIANPQQSVIYVELSDFYIITESTFKTFAHCEALV